MNKILVSQLGVTSVSSTVTFPTTLTDVSGTTAATYISGTPVPVTASLSGGNVTCSLSLSQEPVLIQVASSMGTAPPPQAVAAGFNNLIFHEDFSAPLDIGFGTDGHKWNANLWWKSVPPTSDFVVNNNVLTITGASGGIDLCTQFHDASGGTQFQGGYFEARMMCTDWSSFWLYCWDRPTVFGSGVLPSNPMTWTNEIDIIETDPGNPNTAYCTLHKNTGGDGGVPDAQNNPDAFPMPNGGSPFGQWHTYGVLWTQSTITWYIDNVQIASVPSYASTWQPAQLIISAGPGGVAGSASNVNPPTTQVQWVHVWH